MSASIRRIIVADYVSEAIYSKDSRLTGTGVIDCSGDPTAQRVTSAMAVRVCVIANDFAAALIPVASFPGLKGMVIIV